VAKIALRRTLSGWLPANQEAADTSRKYKPDEIVVAEFKRRRNYKHHCLFMCLLDLTYENLPVSLSKRWPTDRAFRRAVALDAGHCEEFVSSSGEVIRYPLPYDYDHLPDEDDFTVEFGAAMAVCAEYIGATNDALAAEISRYAFERYRVAA
jgi:hypothetical protein